MAVDRSLVGLHGIEQRLPHLAEIAAREALIDHIRGLLQLDLRIRPAGVNDAVLHVALVDDQDHQHAIVR